MPAMTEAEAKQMVESLVSAAMGAAMLNLPPTIAVAMYQRLETEKMRVVSVLVTANAKLNGPEGPHER